MTETRRRSLVGYDCRRDPINQMSDHGLTAVAAWRDRAIASGLASPELALDRLLAGIRAAFDHADEDCRLSVDRRRHKSAIERLQKRVAGAMGALKPSKIGRVVDGLADPLVVEALQHHSIADVGALLAGLRSADPAAIAHALRAVDYWASTAHQNLDRLCRAGPVPSRKFFRTLALAFLYLEARRLSATSDMDPDALVPRIARSSTAAGDIRSGPFFEFLLAVDADFAFDEPGRVPGTRRRVLLGGLDAVAPRALRAARAQLQSMAPIPLDFSIAPPMFSGLHFIKNADISET
jgi:hypothetical protein